MRLARRILFAVLFLTASVEGLAQTSLAEEMATTQAQSELQGSTVPSQGQQQQQQPPPAQPPAQPSAEKKPEVEKVEVEKVEVVKPQEGKVRVALTHMSEHRFFWAGGIFLFTLLILLSTNKLVARRIFGSICVVSLICLIHYMFIGVWLPGLPADYWRGPTSRSVGLRSIKEFEWIPEGNSVLWVVREKNWLGPKNKVPLTTSIEKAMTEKVNGAANLEYGKGFVCNGVPWKNALAQRPDGGPVYLWGAEFKQQRMILILDQPGNAVQKDKALKDILDLLKKIK